MNPKREIFLKKRLEGILKRNPDSFSIDPKKQITDTLSSKTVDELYLQLAKLANPQFVQSQFSEITVDDILGISKQLNEKQIFIILYLKANNPNNLDIADLDLILKNDPKFENYQNTFDQLKCSEQPLENVANLFDEFCNLSLNCNSDLFRPNYDSNIEKLLSTLKQLQPSALNKVESILKQELPEDWSKTKFLQTDKSDHFTNFILLNILVGFDQGISIGEMFKVLPNSSDALNPNVLHLQKIVEPHVKLVKETLKTLNVDENDRTKLKEIFAHPEQTKLFLEKFFELYSTT